MKSLLHFKKIYCHCAAQVCIFAKIFSYQLINQSYMGGGEIVLIILVFLLLFGAKAIPDIAKTLGKAMREFQKATNEIKREINESGGGLGDDIKDIKSTVQNIKSDIQEGVRKHTGDIQETVKEHTQGIEKEINAVKTDVAAGTTNITNTITNEAKTE
jgi:sec-independent protein translocase protein TatA